MQKNTLFIFFLVFTAFFAMPVYADTEGLSWRIDENTLKKGYEFSFHEGLLKVSLPPLSYAKAGGIVLRRLAQEEEAEFPIPPTLEKRSDMFLFDISAKQNKKPLTLLMKPKKLEPDIALYFYDKNKKAWRKLPTRVRNNGFIAASTTLSFAHVALFKEKEPTIEDILNSMRAVIVATESGEVRYAKNTEHPYPIASLTKLMTALVFLDHNPGWETIFTIRPVDDTEPAKVSFRNGDTVSVRDLFYSMLVGSANNSAKALARSTGIPEKEFINEMNIKAKVLGMKHTHFTETSGLDPLNTSSVFDQYILAKTAFHHPDVAKAMTTKRYVFVTRNTKRKHTIKNTNSLLFSYPIATLAKTGYIDEAGYNLTMSAKGKQHEVFLVLFGAPNSWTRFNVAQKIMEEQLPR